jgi:hypothetical protein
LNSDGKDDEPEMALHSEEPLIALAASVRLITLYPCQILTVSLEINVVVGQRRLSSATVQRRPNIDERSFHALRWSASQVFGFRSQSEESGRRLRV